MEFLIKAFIKALNCYGHKYILKKNDNDSYSLDFIDLPSEIDLELVKSSWTYIEEKKESEVEDRLSPYIIKTIKLCDHIKKDDSNIIHIELDKATYARKMSKIDAIFKKYFLKSCRI